MSQEGANEKNTPPWCTYFSTYAHLLKMSCIFPDWFIFVCQQCQLEHIWVFSNHSIDKKSMPILIINSWSFFQYKYQTFIGSRFAAFLRFTSLLNWIPFGFLSLSLKDRLSWTFAGELYTYGCRHTLCFAVQPECNFVLQTVKWTKSQALWQIIAFCLCVCLVRPSYVSKHTLTSIC